MFDFLKKKDNTICMPIKGKCLDISECKDKTFSDKLMGDGFMVEPEENIICSPCDGELTMIFPTKHAFGLKMSDGTEVLVHIGIDTVNLNGQYFEALSSVNKKVKKTTPIIKCDMDKIKESGYDPSVLVIMSGRQDVKKKHLNEMMDVGDIIIEG